MIDGHVKGAFQAGVRAFALVKAFDDGPRLVAPGNFLQRLVLDVAHNEVVVVVGGQAAAAETHPAVVAHGEVEEVLAGHVEPRRQFAQPHEPAHVLRLDSPAPVVEIHGEVDPDALGQKGLDVYFEIGRADDLAGLLVIAEADDNARRLAFRAVIFHQISNAGHGVVIMVHAVNFFVNFLIRALGADENGGNAEVNQLFVGFVAIDKNRVGRQVNVLESGPINRVIHLFQEARIHQRVADHGSEVKALAAERRPFIHRFLENVEGHDAGLEGLVGNDLRVGAKSAFGVADVRHARHEGAGRHQLAIGKKLLRRDVAFGNSFIFETPPKILHVVSAPINHIGGQTIGMHSVVNAPTQLSQQTIHP